MPDLLVYQTSDPAFADRAIEAMREVDIPCYRTGRGAANLNASIGRWTDDVVSIFIQREEDVRRANDILVKLGAAAEEPLRLPNRWVVALLAGLLVVLVLLSLKT